MTGEQGILREKEGARANIFCRDSFNPLLGMLLVSLLHPGLVWVIVPRRERGGSCQLQLLAQGSDE